MHAAGPGRVTGCGPNHTIIKHIFPVNDLNNFYDLNINGRPVQVEAAMGAFGRIQQLVLNQHLQDLSKKG